jgi:hypothetical protein
MATSLKTTPSPPLPQTKEKKKRASVQVTSTNEPVAMSKGFPSLLKMKGTSQESHLGVHTTTQQTQSHSENLLSLSRNHTPLEKPPQDPILSARESSSLPHSSALLPPFISPCWVTLNSLDKATAGSLYTLFLRKFISTVVTESPCSLVEESNTLDVSDWNAHVSMGEDGNLESATLFGWITHVLKRHRDSLVHLVKFFMREMEVWFCSY